MAAQGLSAESAQAGVTKRLIRFTLSTSLGDVDVLVTNTFAANVCPTAADGGHVGVSLPPTPATAGVTPRTKSPRIATTLVIADQINFEHFGVITCSSCRKSDVVRRTEKARPTPIPCFSTSV